MVQLGMHGRVLVELTWALTDVKYSVTTAIYCLQLDMLAVRAARHRAGLLIYQRLVEYTFVIQMGDRCDQEPSARDSK